MSESTFKLKYDYDSNPFEDSSDTESTTLKGSNGEGSHPQDGLEREASRDSSEGFSGVGISLAQKQAEIETKPFRSRLPSISLDIKLRFLRKFTAGKRLFGSLFPSVSLGKHLRLRRGYHRLPSHSRIPVCPPSGNRSTCETCKEAVEYE